MLDMERSLSSALLAKNYTNKVLVRKSEFKTLLHGDKFGNKYSTFTWRPIAYSKYVAFDKIPKEIITDIIQAGLCKKIPGNQKTNREAFYVIEYSIIEIFLKAYAIKKPESKIKNTLSKIKIFLSKPFKQTNNLHADK